MKGKILIVALLLLSLTAASFTGCGSNDTSEVSSAAGGETQSQSGFTENIYDMGGKTITIADSYWIGGDDATVEKNNCADALKEIEKDYNCKINVISPNMSTLERDITTNVAAGKVYANIINFQNEYSSIYRSGNIADVSTISSLGLDSNNWLEIAKEFNSIGGVQYGVAFLEQQCQTLNWNVLVYNKALAEKYGSEDIYTLVRDGNWTYDKFSEICQQVVTKSNGTVKGLINGYLCFPNFVAANNAEFIKQENGKYVYNCLSDNVLNGMQFCYDFNKNGLLDTENYIGDDYGLKESNVFMSRKTLFHLSDFWVVAEVFSSGMPDDYGVVPIPKGPAADDYVGLVTICKSFCFIKGDPDIEDAGAVLVAMANRTALTDEEWVEQQLANSLRDDESGEMLELMMKNPKSTMFNNILGNDWGALSRSCIYDMALTPRQAMEQAQQEAQASIDSFYGQES